MASDFNKPSSGSLRSAFMQEITDMFKDIGKMFNGTTTSNYPTGCIRLNATTHKFETYNGATWDVLDLTGLNVGSVLAKVPAAASGLATLNASSKVVQAALTAEACTGNAATATSSTNAAGTGTATYAGETGLRIVRGRVNTDGSIEHGSGFTISKGGTGVYTINWSPAFTGLPAVVVTIIATNDYVWTSSASVSSVVVSIAGANREWQFVAIGPK